MNDLNKPAGALEGVVVLDLTHLVAGPYCAMLLADLGADVIKIEKPGGASERALEPFVGGTSAFHLTLNRNKRSVTLDLKDEMGRAAFLKMAAQADVVLENFRPGVMEKLGLGWETLSAVNPRLVFARLSGFGQTGRNSRKAGYDLVMQALSGLMAATGFPNTPPVRSAASVSDMTGALSCAVGILAALLSRERTGRGQVVDVALLDSLVAAMSSISLLYFATGKNPAQIGNRDTSTYPYDSFPASDGTVVFGTSGDKSWADLARAMDRPELADDTRYRHIADRLAHQDELAALIGEWTKTRTCAEICALLDEAGISCAPVLNTEQMARDAHLGEDRRMFPVVPAPDGGQFTVTGPHIKLSETPPSVRTPAPEAGADSEAIFAQFGLSEAEIRALRCAEKHDEADC